MVCQCLLVNIPRGPDRGIKGFAEKVFTTFRLKADMSAMTIVTTGIKITK